MKINTLLTAALGLIMSALTAQAGIPVLVRHAYVDSGKQTSKKQLKLTFPNPTTPGDLLVVMAGWTSGAYLPFPQVSDDINGDYVLLFDSLAPVTNGATSFFAYLANCEGGTPTVTIKLPVQQNNIQLDIVEIRGASSVEPVSPNQLNVQGTNNGNNNPPTSGSFLECNTNRTIYDNDIILGCFSWNIPAAMTLISGTPIDVNPGGNSRFASAYLVVPAGTIPIISGTVSQSVFFAGICVAFKAD